MKTVTICGSMRFAREMRRAAFLLESRQGCNVLQCTYPEPGDTVTPEMRQRLEEAHLEKIRISDFIYVVDVGGLHRPVRGAGDRLCPAAGEAGGF